MTISPEIKNSTRVVILAAGEGKRMKSDLPKVLHTLRGKPLLEYVVSTVEQVGYVKPLVVVNSKHTLVQDYLGERVEYVVQAEQLGTGHAVAITEDFLKDTVKNIVVLYGDMPYVTRESIEKLLIEHTDKRNVITCMTVQVPNFEGAFKQFADFGRIVRDDKGRIIRSVEKRDATSEEIEITEVNPCIFCFDAPWLWSHLKMVRNVNTQGEYYLTDLVGLAVQGGYPLSSVSVNPSEAVGINTQEQLAALHN